MYLICIFLVLVFFLTSVIRDRNILSPSSSFTFLYLLVFVLSAFGWYDIYRASDDAYILITLGILCFFLGCMVKRKPQNKKTLFSTGKVLDINDKLKAPIYWTMFVVCMVILLYSAYTILMFFRSGGNIGDVYVLAAAATDGEENELTKNSFQILLESYIAYPVLYLLVPVSVVEFFNTYKKRYLVVAISLALLRVILDARRTYLVAFIMIVAFCFILHRKDLRYFDTTFQNKIKKIYKYSIIIIILIGYVFILISELRSVAKTGEDQYSTLQTLTYYYGGSVQFFEECISKFKIEYTYGFSSLRGFFAPFFGVFKLFGFDSPDVLENANAYLSEIHSHVINISPTKPYNAFATCFFQFYCDFGVVGIVFLSFTFGYYAQSRYDNMLILKNKRAETTYVFLFANILMLSFVTMETVLALNFWPLILVNLLYSAKPIRAQSKGLSHCQVRSIIRSNK